MKSSWLKLIHVAKRQCNLDDQSYRALLSGAAGVDSASGIESEAQFKAVMAAFDRLGFGRNDGKVYSIDDDQMAKAYALWCNLHLLGAVDNRSYGSFMAWVKRMYPQDILRKGQKSQLIEALKRWEIRVDMKRTRELVKGGVACEK